MVSGNLSWITSYIRGIADHVLRDLYVRGKYRDVILPMTGLRRIAEVHNGRSLFAADAWYVPDYVKIGYEISFTRYFYKPKPLRSLEEIRADILALERETEGLLSEIVGSGKGG